MLDRVSIITRILVLTPVVCLCASMAGAQVVTQGLVSYWTFDTADVTGKTAKDVWGNNDGTIMGDPKVVAGKIGQALEFDGDGDYVNCGNAASVGFERTDAFSAEAWVGVDMAADAHMVVIGKMASSGTYRGWVLWYRGAAPDQDTVQILLRSDNASGDFIHVRTQNTLPDSEWIHMAMTYDGSSKAAGVKFYVDGVDQALVVVKDILTDTIKIDMNLNIGARDVGKAPFLKGSIDEVRIYNRALSQDEVKQNLGAEGVTAVAPAGKLAITWGAMKVSG